MGNKNEPPRWRGIVLGNALGLLIGPFVRLLAALMLGFAIVLLSAGWQAGPQPLLDSTHYRSYTAHADGRIVESWLALEFDPASLGEHSLWFGAARGTHCAVVEYAGDWGASTRRAFCGNRIAVHASDNLPRLVADTTMAPGVPFAMPRDARGFVAPDVRMSPPARDWLEHHPQHDVPGAKNALEALRLQIDRPLDDAIAGWSTRAPLFPLMLDPQHPDDAMPTRYVENKASGGSVGQWIGSVLLLAAGGWLWLRGMAWLMAGLPRAAMLFAAIVPLLLLPWWGERMPAALSRLDPRVARVIADMLDDIDRVGRLNGSAPDDATLAQGERIDVGSAYADTFGRIRYTSPQPAPNDADAALRALVEQTTAQMLAFDAADRSAVFTHLADDKRAERYGVGLLFLPSAKQALVDATGDAQTKRAANDFLDAWVTQPVQEPWPGDAGFTERVRVLRELADVPVPEIANRAASIVERASARKL
jgi:hypothetical protein